MREARLREEQEKLEELLKYAHLLNEDDKNLIELEGVKAYDKVLNFDYQNLFLPANDFEKENPAATLVRVFRQPEYWYLACKHILNVELYPFQALTLQQLNKAKYSILLASRGASKSYILALYCWLKLLFNPSEKIVVVGAGLRQSKVIFNYCVNIWNNAPILRDIVGSSKYQGPKANVDDCRLYVGDAFAVFLPVGDGGKIRGYRANCLLVDEFSSLNESIFETVISPFTAVSSSPTEKAKGEARKDLLKRLKIIEQGEEEVSGNQTIISGTADYAFKHFCKYWKRYREIIRSKGDPQKLDEIFPDGVPAKFNFKSYSIIRVPVDLLPPGFMNEEEVARAKATLHTSSYQMEYAACVEAGTQVITPQGVKQIQDMQVGDLVLTHMGRFRKILKTTCRHYDGEMIDYKTVGYGENIKLTSNHPFWIGHDKFVPASALSDSTYLSNLAELNNKQFINTVDYIRSDDYLEADGFIYPKTSRCKFSRHQIAAICDSDKSNTELAKEYGTCLSAIKFIKNNRKPTKGGLPKQIKLNYNFGLVLGYYASEGSVGAKEKMVEFRLDSHIYTPFQLYVSQLTQAIKESVGLDPVVRDNNEDCATVLVNSKYFVELIRNICPGISHNRFVHPDILYSNADFMKGFLCGYWNGDGHVSRDRKYTTCTSTSESLLTQIKVCLSYFGISSTLSKPRGEKIVRYRNKRDGQARQFRNLSIYGQNSRRFMSLIYNDEVDTRFNRNQYMLNDLNKSILKIIKRERFAYSGMVYNLEVEEDNSYSLLNATVHNCFPLDSTGYFRRSLIDGCVAGYSNISFPSCGTVSFTARLRGNPLNKHIIAIDPASEIDNFSIVILEIWPDHRRCVFCWTVNKKKYKAAVAKGFIKETTFYKYCARKIRTLMKLFPCEKIAMDAMGGGIAVGEALADEKELEPGEVPILPIIDPDKPKDTDGYAGDHILELIQFAKEEWTYDANSFLKKDMEDKTLVFPEYDPVVIANAIAEDQMAPTITVRGFDESARIAETLEDIIFEIEELKNELVTIEHSKTATGRDKWDTPEIKSPTGKRGRLRKDRYSALLMANMVARNIQNARVAEEPIQTGFAAVEIVGGGRDGDMYTAPAWYQDEVGGMVVKRGM